MEPFPLRVRSNKGGEAGRIAINTTGFSLDLRTDAKAQDALVAISTDEGNERFLTSTDGVFDVDSEGASSVISSATLLSQLNDGRGINRGSFTVTDSDGNISAINITAEGITTVGELVDAFNDLGIGVSAEINEAGDSITIVDTAGGDGELVIEDTGNGTAASDLGIEGTGSSQTVGGATVTALVGSNPFAEEDEASGLSFTVKKLSDTPITLTVEENPEAVVTAAKTFVDQYNKLVDKLDSLTFFDSESQEVGLLFGSSEALRIETGYTRLLSGNINAAGDFRAIGQVGLKFDDKGKLSLDESKLTDALSETPATVEAFFTTEDTGLAARLESLAERIAGEENSLLIGRNQTLTDRIEQTGQRVDALNKRLDAERERLLLQFYKTEEAISKIQSNQSFISGIQPIEIPE